MRFQARTLCTVKLSRRLYPGHARHNLDSLIDRHGLRCPARHRALGDARAVWQFLRVAGEERGAAALQSVARQLAQLPRLAGAACIDAPGARRPRPVPGAGKRARARTAARARPPPGQPPRHAGGLVRARVRPRRRAAARRRAHRARPRSRARHAHWLRADPVHLRADRDQVLLVPEPGVRPHARRPSRSPPRSTGTSPARSRSMRRARTRGACRAAATAVARGRPSNSPAASIDPQLPRRAGTRC